MTRVVDTSAWIEWLLESPTGRRVEAELPEPDDWVVPTVVLFELAKWLRRELTEDKVDRTLAFALNRFLVPLDKDIALAAAAFSAAHKLAAADSMVYATARAAGADLLTCDDHFEHLPGVVYIAKVKGNS